jgi:hypothetical protein
MTKNVFVIGQKFWAARLQQVLTEHGQSRLRVRGWQVTGGFGGFDNWANVLGSDLFFRVGLRPGSSSIRGRAFDAFWYLLRFAVPRATAVYYWIGTDVSQTLEAMRGGTIPGRAIRDLHKSLHLADAQWLADELHGIGIEASVQRLPGALTRPDTLLPLPETFRVLTYIPDARHRFYGGLEIFKAARELPSIAFDVVGGSGTWIPHPLPNLLFHGWQNDLAPLYQKSSAVVRLVQHDGMGATAVEGLLFGRHVLYTYPLPHAICMTFGDTGQLVETLRSLSDDFHRGALSLNTAGHDWAARAFDASTESRRLVDFVLNGSSKPVL